MTSIPDFPTNLLTNSYILQDFAEIAYIVCTGAIPASANNSNAATDINSPEQILGRLRNAEIQFRKASILVALDADKLELFTFYKKVDVVKDQRTILSKFGYVCRLNSCIIAQKSAARVIDLLKPESARVYRLFTSAILSSIQLSPRIHGKAVRIGTKRYLLPSSSQAVDQAVFPDVSRFWTLHQVDIQIITTGQVILTVYQTIPTTLFLLQDVLDSDEKFLDAMPNNAVLYLAPVGQLAKFKDKWRGTAASFDTMTRYLKGADHNVDKWRQIWLLKATTWINSQVSLDEKVSDATLWIEAEIPVLEKSSSENEMLSSITWKPILWPIQFVYAFNALNHDWTSAYDQNLNMNPLSSAQDWFLNTSARESSIVRMKDYDGKNGVHDDGEHLFDDELQFGGPAQFAPFTTPSFPPSQMVYPTPPDVAMTHHTPGFLSADGMAPTPAAPHLSQEKEAYSPDSEMPDVEKSPASNRIGSGFLDQDEDLFEELPGETFGEGGIGDEPNWDFFDEPGFELGSTSGVPDLPLSKSPLSVGISAVKDSSEKQISIGHASPHSARSHAATAMEQSPDQDSPKNIRMAERSLPEKLSDTNEAKPQPEIDSPVQKARQQRHTSNDQDFVQSKTPEHELSRRRPSLYDGPLPNTGEGDTKYGAEGKYWFDLAPQSDAYGHRRPRPSVLPRPQSSSSDTSMSSISQADSENEDDDKIRAQANGRRWTIYQPNPSLEEFDKANDFNEEEAIQDAEQLLSVLETNSDEVLSPHVAQCRRSLDDGKERGLQRASMLAQIMADQASQSSLFNFEIRTDAERQSPTPQFELSMDNAGSNTILTCASLGDLTSVQPASAQVKLVSKIAALKNFKIRVGRFDGEISAEPSVTRYWDTLNLHPVSGRKDMKGFVLHPRGDNYIEGCDNFIQRLSACYNYSNLGSHDIGVIEGVTDNGLLAWNSSVEQQFHLQQICQHLGTALATSETQSQTNMIYMIVSDDDLASCMDLCDGFITLFESFLKARQSTGGEIALQLIPSSFVIDQDTLAIPSEDQYRKLAIEVYNRLPPSIAETKTVSSGLAVLLAKQPMANLSFELTGKENSPFSREGDCLHLAFAYSADRRWLTATWTDAFGERGLSMSYCLQMSSQSPIRPRLEIFRDLCDISGQLMSKHRKKWWLAVTKAGFYEREEIREWLYLATEMTDSHKSLGRVALVSVELQPRISLQQSEIPTKPAQQYTHQAGNPIGTPVSTPQASMTSPDHVVPTTPASGGNPSTAAQTPPEQAIDNFADTEISLVDSIEESWTATLPFGLNQSHNFLDIWPALASGFLLKRVADANNEANDLVLLGVNLVATPRAPTLSHADRENLLQDLMVQYRGLVTLAASRGCVNSRKECVPWHIAAVVKAAKVLGEIM